MVKIDNNFPGNSNNKSKCLCGHIEDMKHIYSCNKYNAENENEDENFEKIFEKDMRKIKKIYEKFKKNLEKREQKENNT